MNNKKNINDRKLEHINLAIESNINESFVDHRFFYEPIFSNNDIKDDLKPITWFNKVIKVPIWVSSMTGGTPISKKVNSNIAKVCKEFGMGMSLGSCRALLENKDLIKDFYVRDILSSKYPLFANLGIAQIEDLLHKNKINLINDLISELDADGLVIHINLLQEFLQPEGDIIKYPPYNTIKEFIKLVKYPVIIKEVGQGLGPKSIESLIKLPISAFEFAAFGGTNFSKLEIKRNNPNNLSSYYYPLSFIGHNVNDMINIINKIKITNPKEIKCKKFIISGGIKNFLDGYYAMESLNFPSIYGQASEILNHAIKDYNSLFKYILSQINGFKIAKKLLKIKNKN